MEDLSPTSSKQSFVQDTQSHQSSATTQPVQDSQRVPDGPSISEGQLVDTSLMESGTEAISTKFGLDPKKLQEELKEVFQNLSQLIKMLAPGFTNIYPSLDNLLKLVCRIKKALETNSINFAGKTLVFFDYYISANDKINFELHYNRITIANKVAFVLEPFESKELDFQFIAYLPQIWELKQFICADSSILQGNLKSPNIDIQGVTLQNWTDRPLHLEAGQMLYSIEFGEKPEKILCGNRKSELEMKTIFKSYEFNREELMALCVQSSRH